MLTLKPSVLLVVVCLATTVPLPVRAQTSRGFTQVVLPVATGEERSRQRDLWIMEIQFKPMRMAWLDLPDPVTGVVRPEPVWYLPYRALPRPLVWIDDSATRPQNELDVPLGPSLFIPEFTLITYDGPSRQIARQILMDRVIPDVLPVINELERPRFPSDYAEFVDTVSLVQPVMDPIPEDADVQPWIYGVATWSGVDPETDFLEVVMLGFTNGYAVVGDPGAGTVWRKAVLQRFTRLGDEFDQTLREFAVDGTPEWIYVPDEGSTPQAN